MATDGNHSTDGTVVLLMSVEEAQHFRVLLTGAGCTARIACPTTQETLRAAVLKLTSPARLLSFCSGLVVPLEILRQFDAGCFNFHPGPPEYRGIAPSHFAVRDRATRFGATFHTMSKTVDAGPIHRVRRFVLDGPLSRAELEVMAYRELLYLVSDLKYELADLRHTFLPCGEVWSGPLHTSTELRTLSAQ